MKTFLLVVGAFCAGIVADRYLTDRALINLNTKVKINVQNAYLKDRS